MMNMAAKALVASVIAWSSPAIPHGAQKAQSGAPAVPASKDGGTSTDFEADRRRKLMTLLEHPSPRTKADLLTLMQSGRMPKLRVIGPEIAALSRRRFDDIDTLLQARLTDRIDQIIVSYTKSQP